MVELKLLASEFKSANESERMDRDRCVIDMIKGMCIDVFHGTLVNALHLEFSFFSVLMLAECIEYLKAVGIWGLCRHEMGCTQVVNLWIEPKQMTLFVG